MLLLCLVCIPLLGALLSWLCGYITVSFSRWIALSSMGITLLIVLKFWFFYYYFNHVNINSQWDLQYVCSWIPNLGINFHLAIDGLSLLFVLLISFLGFIAVLCSWNEIKHHQNGFYFNLLCVISGAIGLCLSIDLFLFFCFWELILIPTYFLIAIWGNNELILGRNCIHSANKFFIYAQLSGLLLLFSILGLVINYHNISLVWSFDYNVLLHVPIDSYLEWYLMFGFFLSFIIKIPVIPFHTWLIESHSHSSTAGSIDLVGLIVKTSVYGLLRFCIPLFPRSSFMIIPLVELLGVINIFYGSFLAFSQTNIKRLLAYSSVSNMGMILIGIYSGNLLAYQGLIIQIIAHGLSSSALFILSGQLYERFKTMNIYQMGGVWSQLRWIPAFFLFFSMVNLGIPGSGNFIGEFMILLGIFKNFPIIAGFISLILIVVSIYSLNMMHVIFYGKSNHISFSHTVSIREIGIIISLIILIIWIGMYPKIILETSYYSIYNIQNNFSYFFN
ncbi:NADH-quinone oxidoreductase subunit M [Buchnera aphidicola (Eriosoma lanigerum)]|uniref:complex I subunit 4 family protein n=1 Tax=Buchnera aphidicola TaxID=9 RepID=UPI0034649D66